jgi:hypothetical protein
MSRFHRRTLAVQGFNAICESLDFRKDENAANLAIWSQGHLFVAACLAGIFYPALIYLRCNAIERTAFTAFRVQLGLSLRDDHVPCHRFSHQAFRLFAHRFL